MLFWKRTGVSNAELGPTLNCAISKGMCYNKVDVYLSNNFPAIISAELMNDYFFFAVHATYDILL